MKMFAVNKYMFKVNNRNELGKAENMFQVNNKDNRMVSMTSF